MKLSMKLFATLSILAASIALCAPGPDAGSEHFVFVKDNDFYYNTAQGNDLAPSALLAFRAVGSKPARDALSPCP
jgi:hypothetical protein